MKTIEEAFEAAWNEQPTDLVFPGAPMLIKAICQRWFTEGYAAGTRDVRNMLCTDASADEVIKRG